MASDLHAATGVEDCFSITVLPIVVYSGKLLHSSTWSACCSTSSIYLRVCWMVTNFNCMLLDVCCTYVWQYARIITSICVCHPEMSAMMTHSINLSLHILLPDDTSNMAKQYWCADHIFSNLYFVVQTHHSHNERVEKSSCYGCGACSCFIYPSVSSSSTLWCDFKGAILKTE